MTCTIGFRLKDGVIMASDSAGTANDFQIIRRDPKIFAKNNILFGIAGSFRMRDVLMYDVKIPQKKNKQTLDEYVRTDLIDAIRTTFIKKGICKVEDNENTSLGSILLGIENKLYVIDSDFQVGENLDPFAVIGSGEVMATGILAAFLQLNPQLENFSIKDCLKLKDVINTTLLITARYITGVNGPWQSLSISIEDSFITGSNQNKTQKEIRKCSKK